MTQDEIIEMARQAGFNMPWLSHEEHQAVFAFAKLVAAKEREACAKIVDKHGHCWECGGSSVLSEAIRARGQQ